jgi:hypothetical protein
MKTFLSSFLAGSLLATLAAAQTIPAVQLYRQRAIRYNTANRAVDPCTSARPCLPVYVITALLAPAIWRSGFAERQISADRSCITDGRGRRVSSKPRHISKL